MLNEIVAEYGITDKSWLDETIREAEEVERI